MTSLTESVYTRYDKSLAYTVLGTWGGSAVSVVVSIPANNPKNNPYISSCYFIFADTKSARRTAAPVHFLQFRHNKVYLRCLAPFKITYFVVEILHKLTRYIACTHWSKPLYTGMGQDIRPPDTDS